MIDPNYTISYAAGTLTVTPVPEVTAMLVENGLTERSYVDQLTIQFNKPVTSTSSVPMTLTDFGTQGNLDEPVTLTASQFAWTTVPGSGASVLTWSLESFAGRHDFPAGRRLSVVPAQRPNHRYLRLRAGRRRRRPAGRDYVANFFVLQGDVNGDGVVDANDMAAVDAALGSRPGSSNWNPNADLDRSGIVTTSDRIIVYENMGHAIPPAGETAVAAQPARPGHSTARRNSRPPTICRPAAR